MKIIFVKIALLVLVCLQQSLPAQPKASNFNSYLESLKNVPLPFSLYSWNNTELNLSPGYSLQVFRKFKSAAATKPGGIISKNIYYVVLMDFSTGDGGMDPFLTSYDRKGNKIDSLKPFTKTSADQGFFASERLIISKDKKISILDTIKTWKDDSNGKVVKSSVKIKTGKIIYAISSNGRFAKL